MPYRDPEVRKAKASERAARRWLRIKSDPVLLTEHRVKRAAHERTRRERDPFRGKTEEEFRADCVKWTHARRARKRNQFVEHVDPQVVYEINGGMCGICMEFIEDEKDFHVDHVVPLSRGGLHGYINVQPAHPQCNWSKGNHV